MEKTKNILIVAGEASGDLHASELVKAIRDIQPNINFFGLGGKRMQRTKVKLYYDIVDLAVVGFFEVLKNLKKFKDIFNGLLSWIDTSRPDLAILVDYPGFNLRLAKELKKRKIPIIYYISPQVWAWGKHRIKTIKRLVDKMLVIFKFEEELYNKYGVPVSFVGHPLLDIVKSRFSSEEFFNIYKLDAKYTTFALLPGSREKEVKTLLPLMLETAKYIQEKMPQSQFLILRSTSVREEIFNDIIRDYGKLCLCVISDMTYDGLAVADFALVASGTATLETAIIGKPLIIMYKVSFLSWLYLKRVIKIPYIGLVNVVAQKKIVEEFLQYDIKPKIVADYVINTLMDKNALSKIKEEFLSVTKNLGERGASQRAAQTIVDFLSKC
ncbi:MAG: lipid-A-disaccharide synthase [Candidatus Omnitrophica bacterium]|nr:lipid-A-disaccharide synthase [Candidatus Omnitrophota bacterium]